MGAERTQRGISLIELIIVMMLLATMMGLTAPSLSRFMGGRRLTEEARRMVGLLGYARQQAISRGEPMLVWFDEEEPAYGIEPLYLSSATTLPTEEEERATLRFTLAEGLRLEVFETEMLLYSDFRGVVFQPDGTMDIEGVEEARLVNLRDDEVRIVRLAERPMFVIEDEKRDDEYSVQELGSAGYGVSTSGARR